MLPLPYHHQTLNTTFYRDLTQVQQELNNCPMYTLMKTQQKLFCFNKFNIVAVHHDVSHQFVNTHNEWHLIYETPPRPDSSATSIVIAVNVETQLYYSTHRQQMTLDWA